MRALKQQDGVVIITGASSGIGNELYRIFEKKGYNVVGVSRTEMLNQISYQCDVTDRQKTKNTIDEIVNNHGPISLVICNAGGGLHGKQDWFDDGFRETFNLNYEGTINVLEACIPKMIEENFGRIAIMSSVSGYAGLPYLNFAYTSSKATLIHIAESLKFRLKNKNISVQLINPAFVDTPLNKNAKINLRFLVSKEKAAKIIYNGLVKRKFEITFPKLTTVLLLKFLNLLPYRLYFLICDLLVKFGVLK